MPNINNKPLSENEIREYLKKKSSIFHLLIRVNSLLYKSQETKGACHLNYNDVIEGHWYECYDVRNPNRYGSFDCLNCPDYEPYDGGTKWEEREKRNKARAIEAIKKLPDDTVFFFADSHW